MEQTVLRQNLCLSLKESVVRIRNFLKEAAPAEVVDKSCRKKLEDLAFDVDNVLDDLNNIQINQNKLITPEKYLNAAEINGNGDPNHEVDAAESKSEKYDWTTAENCLSKNNHGKVFDPNYRVDTVNQWSSAENYLSYQDRVDTVNHIHKYKVRSWEMTLDGLIAGVKLLLGKVASSPITTEFALLWNLERELENLKGTAKKMKSFLDDIAEMNEVSGRFTRDWLQDLEAAAVEAEFVFEELSYQHVRSRVEEMKKSSSGWADLLSISNNQIIKRHTAATKVKDITQQLKALYEMRNGLNLPMRSSSSSSSSSSLSYVNYGAFVGRENDVSKLADMVCSPAAREQRLSVIPIVGMGGLGKTALAKSVYDDERVLSHFRKRIWLTVSENFDLDVIFNNLLAPLLRPGENHTAGFQRVELLRRIQERLMHKTYLLVLDDVWNEHPSAWKEFITAMEGVSFGKGNVVLVTTRKEKVVHTLLSRNPPPLCVHSLGLLSDEDCWFIIKAVTNFNTSPNSELEAIGKSIAARCGGLPLAAHVVADFLGDRSKDKWISIRTNWISDHDNSISTILKRSFDNLSSAALKKCFAYCSIIPSHCYLEKEDLIELWMAEGLLPADDMEAAGKIFLDDLVQSSLLRDSLAKRVVVTHPLVADLACSLLQPDLFNRDDHQCRYIFSPATSLYHIKKHAKHLRTLFLYGKFSDKLLSRLERLHSLILVSEGITELPSSIGDLIHLKYLDITYTRIEALPESIGSLYLFQTLRATKQDRESYLRKLPVSFKYLLNLRHLHIPNIELPPRVGNLRSLRTLPYFCVGNEEGRRIAELGKLINLTGELKVDNLERVHDKEEAERANLIRKPNIDMLKLAWKNEGGQSSNDDKNVLEGLQPHPNLKILEISGFKGKSLPDWLGSLPSLQLLCISECPKLRCLPSHITNLAQLYITKCPLLTKALKMKPRHLNPEWSKISHIPDIQLDYNQISQHGG